MVLRAATRATHTLPHTLASARGTHGCAHARLCARDSGLSAPPRLPARSRWLSISGRAWGYLLPGARKPSPSFAFQCAPEPFAPRPCAYVSANVHSHTSIADMHMGDNMVKAMGATIAAAMAKVLNNANNDNNNNQGALQAPARGAHQAVTTATGAQPPPPVHGAPVAYRGRGAAAQPPAPLSPEAQLIVQLQRQVAALRAELRRLREENLTQRQ